MEDKKMPEEKTTTEMLVSDKKRTGKSGRLNRILWVISTGIAAAAILFAVIVWKNAGKSSSDFSKGTAAVYSLDINPSIEIGVDLKREVIQIKSLNEAGKKLLQEVNCMGLDIRDCVEKLVAKALELGYINMKDENYVLLSEIMLSEKFETVKAEIDGMTKSSSVNVIFLAGNIKQKEYADSKGISTGEAIFQAKAKEIGDRSQGQ